MIVLLSSPYGNVLAHSESSKTTPAHKSTVTSPKHISIEFSDRIKLIKFVLIHIGGESYPIRTPKRLTNKFTVPLDKILGDKVLSAGDYKVQWRGLGVDGHATQGEFTFTVKP